MDTFFICLANSYKRGGRCIAGIEICISPDDHWSIKRNNNGSALWIRPIACNTEYGEIPEDEARFIHLLSVVRIVGVVPCPQHSHSEDVHYQKMEVIGIVPPYPEVLNQLIDNFHPFLFYSTDFSISIDAYQQGDYSLMMVHPESFSFQIDPTKKRAKYLMAFNYYGVIYKFSITDPYFYRQLEREKDLLDKLSDCYLTLSLGLEYEERHHKLIASVIIPIDNKTEQDPFVVRQNIIHEKYARPFTYAERKACKHCFIVPSIHGNSLYMKMKNGTDKFIQLEDNTQFGLKQTIDLKNLLLVIYEDILGNEVERVRIAKTKNSNFIRKIINYVLKKS